jgi:hypothetical protein
MPAPNFRNSTGGTVWASLIAQLRQSRPAPAPVSGLPELATSAETAAEPQSTVWIVYWPGETKNKLLRAYTNEQEARDFLAEMLAGPPIWRLGMVALPLFGRLEDADVDPPSLGAV